MTINRTIIRVFPRKTSCTPTDELAFVGDPPLIRPPADRVHISVVFTWDIQEAKRLAKAWLQYYPDGEIGGPAFDDCAGGFIPGKYTRSGITITSRGCNNQCPWCLVPKREGKLRELPNIAEGNVIQDNNLLQCNRDHLRKVFEMLKRQHGIQFTGGLDSRLITDDIADDLRGLRINQVFLACDTNASLKPLEKAVSRLQMSRNKLRCYVLLGFNGESLSSGIERLERVWGIGCMPFAQLYQPPDQWLSYSQEWRDLARRWSRPAIMKARGKK